MILTQWKITMKYLLFISLILFCSCHSDSSRKGQGDKTGSIRLQKELYALHRYVDSIIKSDAILQQRFHCSGAGLTKDKVSIDFLDIPEDSFEAFKSAFKKDVFDSPLLEFNIMSDITFGPEIIPIKEDSLGQAVNIVLSPIPRDIPQGEAINPDSLSMRAEYDYYPLSTTEVKVIITNHSRYEYDCGEGYSLTYYNERQKNGKRYRPIRSGMMFYGYFHRTVLPMSRQSDFILLKCPIVQGNIVFTNPSIGIQKWLMLNLKWWIRKEWNKSENGLMIIGWTEWMMKKILQHKTFKVQVFMTMILLEYH